MMQMKSGSGVSESLDVLEQYLLARVLAWKVSYAPPSDFLELVVGWLVRMDKISQLDIAQLLTKATDMVHLLMLGTLELSR